MFGGHLGFSKRSMRPSVNVSGMRMRGLDLQKYNQHYPAEVHFLEYKSVDTSKQIARLSLILPHITQTLKLTYGETFRVQHK